MQVNDLFIHPFKTKNDYYIYDVNTNNIMKVSVGLYNFLCKNGDSINKHVNEYNKVLESMVNNGLISEKRIKIIEHPYSELIPFMLQNRLNTITLQLTQQCNLRCRYCIYSGEYNNRLHSDKVMKFDIAKKGIDFIIKNSSESPYINIGFYGGEPLLEFDLLKRCVKYTKQQIQGRDIRYTMTTNATLLNDEIIEFLVENNFNVLISLDGPEEVHDRNRRFSRNNKGTFKTIMKNISKIKSKYPEYASRMIRFNAVSDGCNDFNCTNKFFSTYEDVSDFNVSITMQSNMYSKRKIAQEDDFTAQLNYERFKILLSKLGRLDANFTSKLLEREYIDIRDRIFKRDLRKEIFEKEHPGGPCVPGIRKLFMDVDGNFYPCERVSEASSPMLIGNADEGFNVDKILRILNIGKISEEACKNCWAYRFCYLCAAYADSFEGFSKEKRLSECRNVKFNAESMFIDYCTLLEYGFNFEEEIINK